MRLVIIVWLLVIFPAISAFANGNHEEREVIFSGRNNVLEIGPEVLNDLSREEQQWYKHFQEGILFFDGWASISEEVLTVFPEHHQKAHQQMMQRIGIKIGTEWAKDNSVRKIDTAMLKQWGDVLRNARSHGPEKTLAALEEIETEVDLILQDQGRLMQVSR